MPTSEYLLRPALSLPDRIQKIEADANDLMDRRLSYQPALRPGDEARYQHCILRAAGLYGIANKLRRYQ